MSRLFQTLQSRLVLLIVVAIFPGILLLTFQIVQQRNHAIEHAKEKSLEVLELLALDQSRLIVDTKVFLKQLAQFDEVQQLEMPVCSAFVRQVLQMNSQYENIGAPRADGDLLCNASPLKRPVNVADRPYIRRAMDEQRFSMGEFQMDRAAGITSVNFAYPVVRPSDGRLLGAIVAVVSLEWWSQRLAESRLPENSIAYITDAEGTVIAHYPLSQERLGKPVSALYASESFPVEILPDSAITISKTAKNESRIFVSTRLTNALGSRPITVGISVPFESELSVITKQTIYGAVALVVLVLLTLLLAIWGIRKSILTPLKKLSDSTGKLANGIVEPEKSFLGALELVELQQQFADMASTRMIVEHQLEQSQSELRESQNYNRTLLEASPIGLVLSTMNGELTDINTKYADITGYTKEEALQLNQQDITPEKYHLEEARQLDSLEVSGRYGPYEKEYIHKDGHTVPVRLSGICLKRNGQDYIWSCVEDVTELKQLEEQVRRSQKMDAVGALAGGIAHDFNNILAIIQGNLELTRQFVQDNGHTIKRIDAALDATQRGAKLTRKLLSFSRVEDRELARVEINPLIEQLISFISKSLTVSIQVKTHLAGDLWPVILDPQDFEDAILNLSLNARDAMLDGGTLIIETRNKVIAGFETKLHSIGTTHDFVMMSISDTGSGMDEETKDRVFEPFFTTKETGKGTGLGLSMVYGFVKRSHGYIKVYSEPGEGTSFCLFFPRASSDVASKPLPRSEGSAPLGSETILVVDDEASLRDIAATYLADLGYTVFAADSGEEAIRCLIKNPEIELVFSDVIMPGEVDGYQLALACKEIRPDLRILLTSGYTRKLERLEKGSHAYLSQLIANLLHKPYGKLELALRIRQILDMPR